MSNYQVQAQVVYRRLLQGIGTLIATKARNRRKEAAVAKAAKDIVLERTAAGIDTNGRKFRDYSPAYKRFKTGAVTGDPFSVMLWSYWGPAGCDKCTNIGDYVYKAVSWQTVPSSSGGTSVPEPGMVGLMGLGVMGMAFARRRRVNTSVNMAPLAA